MPLTSQLNAILDRELHAAMPFPKFLPDIDLSDQDLAEAVLLEHNPELKELEASTRRGRLQVELQKKARLPDFMVGVEWIQIGDSDLPIEGSGRDAWAVKLGANLPIWRGKNRARVAQSRAHLESVEWTQRYQTNRMVANAKQIVSTLRDYQRKMVLHQESLVPKAREALDVFLIGFESGEATYLDLIDAENRLLELRLALFQLRGAMLAEKARLDRLLGRIDGFAESEES